MLPLFRSKHHATMLPWNMPPWNILPWYIALAFLIALPTSVSAMPAVSAMSAPISDQSAPSPLKVIASIAPIYALAASVMKGVGTPHLFVRPNQSPHDYVLRPSDAQHLSDAHIVFWIGEELEPFLSRPLKNIAPQAEHVRLLDTPGLTLFSVQTRHAHHTPKAKTTKAIDPHIWLDIDNAILILQAMAKKFIALDPAHETHYSQNAQALIDKLQKLDTHLATQLAPLQNHPYFTFHDAYQYFERRYGLHAQGIVNLRPDLSIGPKALNALRTKARAFSKFCVFMEPEFDQQTTRKYFADMPAQFAQLDPLGANVSLTQDFFPSLLNKMGQSINDCLSSVPTTPPQP